MKTDEQLQKDVMAEIKWEPILNAAEIGVSVKHGVVTLNGTVDSYTKKLAAERVTKKVAGVKAVAEEIEVKINEEGEENDTEIAEAALKTLRWHSALKDDNIKVKVEKGWVTLEGSVEWEFQKKSAQEAVDDLNGVKGITNLIRIVPKTDPKDVKQKISAAFHRSATIDAEKLDIKTEGSKVVLSGKVRSLAEKEDAERAAWSAPGITDVVNDLIVQEKEIIVY